MFLCLAPLTVCARECTPATDVRGASTTAPAIPAPGEAQLVPPESDLSDFLKSQGYIEIPLVLAKDGSLNVKVQVNNKPLDFTVDTGANKVVLDTAVARRLELPLKESGETFAGITGAAVLSATVVVRLSIGPIQSQADSIVADLGAFNQVRKENDTSATDGFLGNDILQLLGAVIDHSTAKLFLIDPATIFSLQSGQNARWNLNQSLKDGRVKREVTIDFLDERPRLVTTACFDALEPGMTASGIFERIGGGVKAQITPTYTGTLTVAQQSSRIDLEIQQGKVVSKSARGLE
jgi:predicted aspartyl protease